MDVEELARDSVGAHSGHPERNRGGMPSWLPLHAETGVIARARTACFRTRGHAQAATDSLIYYPETLCRMTYKRREASPPSGRRNISGKAGLVTKSVMYGPSQPAHLGYEKRAVIPEDLRWMNYEAKNFEILQSQPGRLQGRGRCDVSADRPICIGTLGGNLPASPATGDRLLRETMGRIGAGVG